MEELSDLKIILETCKSITYLDHFLKNDKLDQQYKTIMVKYHKLLLTDTDIFPRGLDRYLSYMLQVNTPIWENFVNNLTDDKDVEKYTGILINFILTHDQPNASHGYKSQLFDKILFNNRTIQTLNNNKFWKSHDLTTLEKRTLAGTLIEEDNFKLIDRLILSPVIFNCFLEWVIDILNFNKGKININTLEVVTHSISYTDDFYLFKISTLLFNIFNSLKVDNIDWRYLINKNTKIQWLTKKDTTNNEFSNYTKICCVILYYLHVAYVPILDRAESWDKLIKKIEDEINILAGRSLLGYVNEPFLRKELKFVMECYDTDKLISNNKQLLHNVMNFQRLITNSQFCNIPDNFDDGFDSIVNDYISLCLFLFEDETSEDTTSNVNFCLNVIKDPRLINLQTKFSIIEYCLLRLSFLKQTDNIKQLNQIVVDHILEIDKKEQNVDSLSSKTKIYDMIVYYNLKIMDCDNIDKFYTILSSDICELDDILVTVQQIVKETTTEVEHKKKLKCAYDVFFCLISIVNNVDFFLDECMGLDSELTKNNIGKKSVVTSFVNGIHATMKQFCNMIQINGDQFSPSNNFHSTFQQTFTFSNQRIDNLTKFVAASFTILDTLLKFNKNVQIDNFSVCETFANKINKPLSSIQYLKPIEIKYTEEIPDKYLDLLTYEPIIDPVKLPETDGYFERSNIEKCLLQREENPYNRQPLTFEQFQQYNNTLNIKTELDNFVIEFNEWKDKYKMSQ